MSNSKAQYYTVDETSEVLNVPRSKVMQFIASPGFPAIRVNRRWRINKIELKKWVKKQEEQIPIIENEAEYYKIEEAAEILGISRTKFLALALSSPNFPIVNFGPAYRIYKEGFEQWRKDNAQTLPAQIQLVNEVVPVPVTKKYDAVSNAKAYNKKNFFTPYDIAKILNLSYYVAVQLIKSDDFPHERKGQKYYINKELFYEWQSRHMCEANPYLRLRTPKRSKKDENK